MSKVMDREQEEMREERRQRERLGWPGPWQVMPEAAALSHSKAAWWRANLQVSSFLTHTHRDINNFTVKAKMSEDGDELKPRLLSPSFVITGIASGFSTPYFTLILLYGTRYICTV